MKSNHLILSIMTLFCTASSIQSMEQPADAANEEVNPRIRGYRPLKHEVAQHEMKKLLGRAGIRQDASDKPENHDIITELPLLKLWTAQDVCDQGNQGSCTANSLHFVTKYLSLSNSKNPSKIKGNPDVLEISRAYQYHATRYYEGNLTGQPEMWKQDTGGSIAGSVIALDKYGACPESTLMIEESITDPYLRGRFTYRGFPYNDAVFDLPPDIESCRIAHEESWSGLNLGSAFAKGDSSVNPYASVAKVVQYQDLAGKWQQGSGSMNTVSEQFRFTDTVIRALRNGHPVAAGVMLDDSFMKGQHGYIPTPDPLHFRATGGHAISIVGYGPYNPQNKGGRYFKFINSWGPTWGDKGFGYFDEKYFANVKKFDIEAYETWFDMSKLQPASK